MHQAHVGRSDELERNLERQVGSASWCQRLEAFLSGLVDILLHPVDEVRQPVLTDHDPIERGVFAQVLEVRHHRLVSRIEGQLAAWRLWKRVVTGELIPDLIEPPIEQILLVPIVKIEGGAVDRRPIGDVLDRDGVVALLGDELDQSISQQLPRAKDSWVQFLADLRHHRSIRRVGNSLPAQPIYVHSTLSTGYR